MSIASEARGPSLHQRILTEIEDKIISGEWQPGTRIPFEHELTAQFGCSRMTVSKALTQLANAGLIERRRKAGSFVRRPHSQSAVLEIQEIRNEVAALGLPYRYEITSLRQRRATAADRKLMNLPASGTVVEVTCTHFAGPRPFCLEERLINLKAVPEAAAEDFAELAPGPWLLRQVPWTNAEHRIRGTGADAGAAAAFKLPEGAACLVVERRTWSADQPVTFVRLTYPGDGHELVARFAPTQN